MGSNTSINGTEIFDIILCQVQRRTLSIYSSQEPNIITEAETIQSQSHNNQRRRIHNVSVYTWSTQGRDLEYHELPQLALALPYFSPVIATNS